MYADSNKKVNDPTSHNHIKVLNDRLEFACMVGNTKLAEFLVNQGATDINRFLIACRYGHLTVVEYLFDAGANDFDNSMSIAWKHKHYDIANNIIEVYVSELNYRLETAGWNGNFKEVVALVENNGATSFNKCLAYACRADKNQFKIINYMIEKGADDWDSGLYYACTVGNIEIVKFMLSKGAEDLGTNCFTCACEYGYIKIVKLFIKLYKQHEREQKHTHETTIFLLNHGLLSAASGGQLEIAKLLMSEGAVNVTLAMLSAEKNNQDALAEFFGKNGAAKELTWFPGWKNKWV